jgi:putative restriction endonuclease
VPPHLDALFDGGWMTVETEGNLLFSKRLPTQALQQLGVPDGLKVEGLTEAHQGYLDFHRDSVFED